LKGFNDQGKTGIKRGWGKGESGGVLGESSRQKSARKPSSPAKHPSSLLFSKLSLDGKPYHPFHRKQNHPVVGSRPVQGLARESNCPGNI
jgi:hypothetical protein